MMGSMDFNGLGHAPQYNANEQSAVRIPDSSDNNHPAPKITFGKSSQPEERVNFDSKYYQSRGMNIQEIARESRPEI